MAHNDLTTNLVKELERYERINQILKTGEFHTYIEEKCYEVLNKITENSLRADPDEKYSHTYRKNHKVKATDTEVTISNETMVDVNDLHVKHPENYPSGFDLAKAVEYGTGIKGASSGVGEYAKQDGWEYDIHGHGLKGWFYVDDSGQLHWTQGMNGNLIFEKAKNEIEENISNWIDEYIEKNI